jgi:excisionase family DNA binding protein
MTTLAAVPAQGATLLTVEQVAVMLKLNVRTIRNYVRSGSLKATRIGKQYRITLGDLQTFTGRPVAGHEERSVAPGGRVEVSSIIHAEGVTAALAERITTLLAATAEGLSASGEAVAVATSYDGQSERMRVLLAADLQSTRDFLAMINALLGAPTEG